MVFAVTEKLRRAANNWRLTWFVVYFLLISREINKIVNFVHNVGEQSQATDNWITRKETDKIDYVEELFCVWAASQNYT